MFVNPEQQLDFTVRWPTSKHKVITSADIFHMLCRTCTANKSMQYGNFWRVSPAQVYVEVNYATCMRKCCSYDSEKLSWKMENWSFSIYFILMWVAKGEIAFQLFTGKTILKCKLQHSPSTCCWIECKLIEMKSFPLHVIASALRQRTFPTGIQIDPIGNSIDLFGLLFHRPPSLATLRLDLICHFCFVLRRLSSGFLKR